MATITNERLILASLCQNEDYTRKVLAFIKPEYFADSNEKKVFEHIQAYVHKYNHAPNLTTLKVALTNDTSITEATTDECASIVDDAFDIEPPTSLDWLVQTSEEFCQERAVYNAIQRAISIYQKEEKGLTAAAIPDILQHAIAVCFDNTVGTDYFDDAESRWEYYTNPETKIPFLLDIFNEVTNGGVTRKTLNYIVAGVNVGKSMSLVSLAADYCRLGYNVLYFSMEMSEQEVMKRFDANMMKIAIADIVSLGKERFMSRMEALRAKSYGKFKVKEFPPGSASVVDFQRVIDELKIKQSFTPTVIMVDYTQITASARMKYGQVGSYYYYKSVAEELRALMVKNDAIGWSAAQFNRGNMANTDADMDGISESVGIAHTADGMWAFARTDELDQAGQLLVKQMKSRYANKAVRTRFTIGVDVDKQTLYTVNQSQQADLVQPEQTRVPTATDTKNRFMTLS